MCRLGEGEQERTSNIEAHKMHVHDMLRESRTSTNQEIFLFDKSDIDDLFSPWWHCNGDDSDYPKKIKLKVINNCLTLAVKFRSGRKTIVKLPESWLLHTYLQIMFMIKEVDYFEGDNHDVFCRVRYI